MISRAINGSGQSAAATDGGTDVFGVRWLSAAILSLLTGCCGPTVFSAPHLDICGPVHLVSGNTLIADKKLTHKVSVVSSFVMKMTEQR